MEQRMTRAEPAQDIAPKWVFTFGAGRADGSAADRASDQLVIAFI